MTLKITKLDAVCKEPKCGKRADWRVEIDDDGFNPVVYGCRAEYYCDNHVPKHIRYAFTRSPR